MKMLKFDKFSSFFGTLNATDQKVRGSSPLGRTIPSPSKTVDIQYNRRF
jgi:hypothetical protein